jgi:hypothetical protein
MSLLCPLDHDRPRHAELPSVLCGWHIGRTLDALHALIALPGDASAAAAARHLARHLASPVSGSRTRQLPIDEPLADLIREARGVVASWCLLIAEERDVIPPSDPALPVTAAWLAIHAAWATAQPWADDWARELLDLAGRARALLAPSHTRRVTCGPCTEVIEGARCMGTLTARVRDQDDLLPSVISCQVCGVDITADGWVTLGRRIREVAA